MKNTFTKSENFKSEYSCAVVRIDDLTPIEGSDFLAKTLVQGTQIVVRKDCVKTGDVMIYAANETQLNEKFLSLNNLFDIGCRDKNSNIEQVTAILQPYLDTKPVIDKLRADAKNIKNIIDQLTKKSSRLNKEVKRMTKDLAEFETGSQEYETKSIEIKDKQEKADVCYKKAIEKTTTYTNLKKQIEKMVNDGEPVVTEAKKMCGFFNKYGRVRCITLRGEPSFGFLFSVNELQKFDSSVSVKDVEDYVDQEFDTVNGELFVKAYIPPVKPTRERKERTTKAQKKIARFDRMIDGQLIFHYDTLQLQKNIHFIKPDDVVTITDKIHGTSGIFGNLLVRQPRKINIFKKLMNKICGIIKTPKMFIDYDEVYGPVYSSRTVIKNKYISPNVTDGFYNQDVWSEWGDRLYPYLDEGMAVYCEIFGRLNGGKYIQKLYDYGCEDGVNKLMIYRITTSNSDSTKFEWEVNEVHEFTLRLIERMKENDDPTANLIHPIDILYHGTLANLYPDLDTENHWHENVLERMKNDKEHFGMETIDERCTNNVPKEGIVLRKYNDTVKESFKLKCANFLLKEAIAYDSDNYEDIEVTEGNY